jgi:hypothetical protein
VLAKGEGLRAPTPNKEMKEGQQGARLSSLMWWDNSPFLTPEGRVGPPSRVLSLEECGSDPPLILIPKPLGLDG